MMDFWLLFGAKHMWPVAYFIVHHSVIQCSPVFSPWAGANHNDRALQTGLTGMHILDGSVHKQRFGVHAFPLSPLICPLKRLGLGPVSKRSKTQCGEAPTPTLNGLPFCFDKKQALYITPFSHCQISLYYKCSNKWSVEVGFVASRVRRSNVSSIFKKLLQLNNLGWNELCVICNKINYKILYKCYVYFFFSYINSNICCLIQLLL